MIEVQGYSGCGIHVFPDPQRRYGVEFIVEKSTDDPSYVPRLLQQMEKQNDFVHSNALQAVRAPKILYRRVETLEFPTWSPDFSTNASSRQPDTAAHEEPPRSPLVFASGKPLHCTFGMPFERHVDALSFLYMCSVSRLAGFAQQLIAVLEQYLSWSPMRDVSVTIFSEKVIDIGKRVQKNTNISKEQKSTVVDVIVPYLLQRLKSEGATMQMPLGKCHGDLTMSNILVEVDDTASEEAPIRIVLIDFLDSFVESPLADIAKLYQDLLYGWTIRVSHEPVTDPLRLFSVFGYLHDIIDAKFQACPWYRRNIHFMLILNQLRVLQYSKDIGASNYLMNTVLNEFNALKNSDANSR